MIKANFQSIRNHAYDTVRYLRNNDYRAYQSYYKYLQEGTKAPGYAKSILIDASNENIHRMGEFLDNGDIDIKTAIGFSMVPKEIRKLDKNFVEECKAFEDSFKKMYPKSRAKREAIMDCVSGLETRPMTPCKKHKFIKIAMTILHNIID